MIDRERKIIFIHIPKCGGTFIEENITPNIDWHNLGGKHSTLEKCIKKYGEKMIKDCYRFTIVRNPYERLVSFYLYHKRNDHTLFESDKFPKKKYFDSFKSFIFNIQNNRNFMSEWVINDMKNCHKFIDNSYGINIHDIFKLEEIEEWLPILQNKIGIVFSEKKVNVSPEKYDYRTFYSDKEVKFVRKFYKKDLCLFYPDLTLD